MIILDMLEPYLQELSARNYSQETINRRVYSLRSFIHFLGLREVVLVDQLNADVLEEYKHDLTFRHTDSNKKLSAQTKRGYLSVVRSFCGYLHGKELLVNNPAADLVMPKIPKRLPRVILTLAEIRKLIDGCDMNSNRGYRNRIIIEILYDTGVRGSELCRINCDDLDLAGGFLHIKSGKGDKDRVVPISSRVCDLIRRYKMLVRPAFARADDDGTLILNRYGKMFSYKGVLKIVKICGAKAGL
ncbi:MAG: tyrosine-type recombinase/integrase, partial [Deltaproteobacteria bacterium]|nr:tyrosine-type recombinase/integrase [Deltaproteobacteria bacterium]